MSVNNSLTESSKGKGKVIALQARCGPEGGWLYSSMTATLEGGEWSAACPGRTLPPGKTRYPLYRRLGGPQGRSGRAENLVPTGIRSQTLQPVAQSLYRLSYRAHQPNQVSFLYHSIHYRFCTVVCTQDGSLVDCAMFELEWFSDCIDSWINKTSWHQRGMLELTKGRQ